jgi:uncharacterized protein YbjQ (UPF0145 family)
VIISGMSGNEIYCLSLKHLYPGEIVVGNSVCSMGISGALGSFGQSLAGGEISAVTELISTGRHAAITRMEQEAQRHGATGVTSVVSELRYLAGYTEFLAQGTGVHAEALGAPFFSSAASGMELYCHLDAGYRPVKFVMGNIAYALGVGRGLTGSLRTFAKGEVTEYSQMYNEIRHHALERLRAEAAAVGANAVVDVQVRMLPYGVGTIELLMTGTASHHDRLAQGPLTPDHVVTSELTGEELWNLAKLGYAPVSLVMATSVYSLGMAAGIGTWFQSMRKGELPEVTELIYHARENCLNLLRQEATRFGAERVIGNKLTIMELSPGLVEIVAIGTAVRRVQGMAPESPQLPVQAVIIDREALEANGSLQRMPAMTGQPAARGMSRGGCLVVAAVYGVIILISVIVAIVSAATGPSHGKRRGSLESPVTLVAPA